jgi:hypothetical protein
MVCRLRPAPDPNRDVPSVPTNAFEGIAPSIAIGGPSGKQENYTALKTMLTTMGIDVRFFEE